MPTISPSMLPELDQEMAGTRKAFERMPGDRLDWRPHESSWTMLELATHVSHIPRWGKVALEETSFDIAPDGEPLRGPQYSDVDQLLDAFDETVEDLREAVEGTSDEAWMENWTLLNHGATVFGLPRIAVFRTMVLNHMIHHRGQLTVYLRSTGARVPGLYGPSADDV